MANKIKISVSATLTNGLLKFSYSPGAIQIDQTLQVLVNQVIVVGTSEEDLVIPADMTSEGITIFYNLDATNFVQVGKKVAGAMESTFKLMAGDPPSIFSAQPGITWRALADTADCKIQHIILGR